MESRSFESTESFPYASSRNQARPPASFGINFSCRDTEDVRMSKTRKPLPHISLYSGHNGRTLSVWHGDGPEALYDFDFLPELRPMLLRCYDLDVVQAILTRCCRLFEGLD